MQVRASGSTEIRRWQYFDQSITTAVLVHSPARLVPPPRETIGARWRRHAATAATAGLHRPGYDDAERGLAEVGGVGRICRAGAGIEANLAVDRGGEVPLERGDIDLRDGLGGRRGPADRVRQQPGHRRIAPGPDVAAHIPSFPVALA